MPIADDFAAIADAARALRPEPARHDAPKLRMLLPGTWRLVCDGQEIGLCDVQPVLVEMQGEREGGG